MRVLVADDQTDLLSALRLLFRAEGVEGVFVTSPDAVVRALESDDGIDIALLDLNYSRDTTSGAEGLDLLARIRRLDPALPILVMTAWSSVPTAVEAMRRGARDFVEKPWDNEKLMAALRHHGEGAASKRQAGAQARAPSVDEPRLLATSKAMQPVLEMIARIAPSDANVLVTGEHGTGKDVVARTLHARSRRGKGPFVPVNVGALASGVFESELFGHVRGAFTGAHADRAGCFELAHGGTLFLDEIGTLALEHQAKLLRVLQSGEISPVGSHRVKKVDVRIVAATNARLRADAHAGRFREDLFYRLNTIEIALPPLRDRADDVPLLARHFMGAVAARYGLHGVALSVGALEALRAYDWPGNVRELSHTIERVVLMARGPVIEASDLGLDVVRGSERAREAEARGGGSSALDGMTLEEAESYLVERALLRADGNANEAARLLGLSRSAFYRRLQAHRGGGGGGGGGGGA